MTSSNFEIDVALSGEGPISREIALSWIESARILTYQLVQNFIGLLTTDIIEFSSSWAARQLVL
jgi:hypothetical protein